MAANIVATIYIHIALAVGTAYSFFLFKKQEVIHCFFIWSLITATAFLSNQIWTLVFVLAMGALYLLRNQRQQILSYYFMALPVLPLNIFYRIPSPFPDTNELLTFNYYRLISLFIIAPIFLRFISHCYFSKFFNSIKSRLIDSPVDLLVLLYSFLMYILCFRDLPSLTAAIKNIIYISLIIPFPYYAISRYVLSFKHFIKIFLAITFTAVFLSFIVLLETVIDWDFYNILHQYLGIEASRFVFLKLYRSGFLRIEGTMGQPIAFGYFMILAIGILLFLKKLLIIKKIPGYLTFFLFITALFLTGSRGPWLCCIVLIFLFWGLPKINLNIIGIYMFAGILALAGIASTAKNILISLDPYGTFSYRIALIQNSLMTIQKNLWLGSANYFSSVEMEEMRQGQGIIDIVNSYLQIALHSGVIGLFLFVLIFIILIFQIFKCVKRISRKNSPECFYLGILMASTLTATMLLIGTVSMLPYIKLYCWSFIALGSAYVRFIHAAEKEAVVDCRI